MLGHHPNFSPIRRVIWPIPSRIFILPTAFAAPARPCSAARLNCSTAKRFWRPQNDGFLPRSEEHTSELQSQMRIPYAVFCLNKKIQSLLLQQKTNTTYLYKLLTKS